MEQISFPGNSSGNKLAFCVTGIVALALCTVVGTYRLKKVAELKHWEKELASYSKELEYDNKIAKGESYTEIR